MQRRLIVMRHAKSDWGTDAPPDHDRPLNKRGRKDAPRIAQRLCEGGWIPEIVLSSDSQRTRETYGRMSDALSESLGSEPQVLFLGSLYHAGVAALESALSEVPDNTQTVMALGHNPGWEQVVGQFCGEWVRMTTANAALLTIEANHWADAATARPGSWTLVDVLRPKEL